MRFAAMIAVFAVLTGCSGPPQGSNANGDRMASGDTAASDTASTHRSTEDVPPPAARGTGLRAAVSDLQGDVSGLDIRVTDLNRIIDLPADALFDYDKAILTSAAESTLRKATDIIRAAPAGPIGIVGHSDDHGSDAYNQRLSEARARSVADWFGQQAGLRQRSYSVSGKGESSPIVPNVRPDGSDDPAGRARNRRVEVVMPK